ncbi:response regulator [Vibrio sp. SM6]|uniref:Response regulator n=1 Tax=Vibrio agarilyticus TaxID=2726741 RepID=A0A7X8YG71_9VIBR|nr:response regulator [Vibrio agarilyticus]NLS12101.1 response regulator [Vibrio agarilyticus]
MTIPPCSRQFSSHDTPVILCAQPQPTNQFLLAYQLSSLGYAYEMLTCGQQVWDKWQTGHYTTLITACQLPNLDPFELTDTIRETEQYFNLIPTRIIATTPSSLAEAHFNCLDVGMDHCVNIPFTAASLRSLLVPCPLASHQRDLDTIHIPSVSSSSDRYYGIDISRLMETLESHDEDLIETVVTLFHHSAKQDIDEIKHAVITMNPTCVQQKAHALNSAALSIGAFQLSGRFKQIEANSDDTQYVKAQLASIEHQLDVLGTELDLLSDTKPT